MAENTAQQEIRTDIPHPKDTLYTRCIKRVLDILLSGIAILVLSPVLLILMLLELIFHGRPIFYMDKRPGKDGKIFEMYKFRSMLNETERDGKHLTPAERITPFGRFLRRTSLDELPGLFNVFNGTMSVIGPRPLMVDYLPLYNERHRYRHCVRPGLACWRIGGTDKLTSATWTWNDQFESDIYYVEHVSFLLDAEMVLKTFKILFSRSEMRTNSNRVKFDGKNLLETRTKKQILADEARKAEELKEKEEQKEQES
ncbi:MAG: sugar transferase [Lachnospiraceae bacterium]|nr:sugar transferase [Lachnospiraceae bacterium]